jgi:hypothetical protein
MKKKEKYGPRLNVYTSVYNINTKGAQRKALINS